VQIDTRTRNILISVAVLFLLAAFAAAVWSQTRRSDRQVAVSVSLTQTAAVNALAAQTEQVITPSPVDEQPGENTVTASPSAPAEQQPSANCLDDAVFVADVTLPDGTVVEPGAALVKTWRVQNTGTCSWNSNYQLVFAGGDRLDSPERISIGGDVQPGADFDVSVSLTAPTAPGRYQGQWILANPAGQTFGQVVYYEIQVSGTPAIAYFTASQYYVVPGTEVILSWDLSRAYDGAYLRVNGAETGVVAPGSTIVTPQETTRYELVARNDQGESVRSLAIVVTAAGATPTFTPPPSQLPTIAYFRADRYEIQAGESVILSWDLSGATGGAYLIVNGDEEGVVAPGAKSVTPEATTEYKLVARNAAGEAARSVTIVVSPAAGQEDTPMPPTATAPEIAPTTAPTAESTAEPTVEPATPTSEAPPEPTIAPTTPITEPVAPTATFTATGVITDVPILTPTLVPTNAITATVESSG